jgi:ferric-dicitrate binding protein FerR (iron transport regulator)
MQKKPSAEILEKYFKGDCNENEIAEIQSWYESFENNQDDISLLSDDEKDVFRVFMLDNIRKNIRDAEINNTADLKPQGPNRSLFYFIAGIAAILLIAFFLKYNMRDITPEEKREEIVVNNKTNTIQKITLSDGSRVWLSPNSQLAYLKLFDKNSRQVTMNGEAFFEVTKDHKRPFSIHSGRVITKVWGTSFRIRAFKNEITKVDVVTGKVSVSIPAQEINLNRTGQADKKQEIMLLPDQEATYDNLSDHLIKNSEIKDPLINMWKKVSVSFENTPMRTVFSVLNKKFKVHIKSDDQGINADSLNADFTDESLPAILEMMKKTLNVNYQVSGNEFVLISNK